MTEKVTELEIVWQPEEGWPRLIGCKKKQPHGNAADCQGCKWWRWYWFQGGKGYFTEVHDYLVAHSGVRASAVCCAHPDAQVGEKVDHLKEALSVAQATLDQHAIYESIGREDVCRIIRHIKAAMEERRCATR